MLLLWAQSPEHDMDLRKPHSEIRLPQRMASHAKCQMSQEDREQTIESDRTNWKLSERSCGACNVSAVVLVVSLHSVNTDVVCSSMPSTP